MQFYPGFDAIPIGRLNRGRRRSRRLALTKQKIVKRCLSGRGRACVLAHEDQEQRREEKQPGFI